MQYCESILLIGTASCSFLTENLGLELSPRQLKKEAEPL